MLRVLALLLFAIFSGETFAANDWVNMLAADPTGGLVANHLCYSTNGRDVSCDLGAPLITSGTMYVPTSISSTNGYFANVSASMVSATTYYGDGSHLTGIAASGVTGLNADRIVSNATSMLANGTTNIISITNNGVNTGYFNSNGVLTTPGISATANLTSVTTFYASGNVGVGTSSPGGKLDVNGTISGTSLLTSFGTSLNGNLHWTLSNVGGTRFGMGLLNIEGGSTTGSNFAIWRYDDSSSLLGGPALYIRRSTGNVGMGTANPNTALEVNGTISASNLYVTGTTGTVSATNGYFGVVSATTYYGDGSNLTGISASAINGLNIDRITSGTTNLVANGTTNIISITTNGVNTSYFNTNGVLTAPGISATANLTSVTSLYASGNVGVGTNAPSLKVDIVGTSGAPANTGTAANGAVRLEGTLNNVLDMGLTNASPNGGWISVSDKTDLSVHYPLLLNPVGGNVGIGIINPSSKLEVAGAISASNVYVTGTTGTVSATYGYFTYISASGITGGATGDRITSLTTNVTANGNTNIISITTNGVNTGYFNNIGVLVAPGISATTNQTSVTTLYASGKVGIGDATPSDTLHVYSNTSGSAGLTIENHSNANGAYTRVLMYNDALNTAGMLYGSLGTAGYAGPNGLAVGTFGPGALGLYTNNVPRLFISSTATLVGIGTTTPNATLDVIGTISATIINATSPNGTVSATYGYFTYISASNLSAGGGSNGDRITSGTTSMVAQTASNIISITTNGVNTGYFNSNGVLTVPGISATANLTSVTTLYASGAVTIKERSDTGLSSVPLQIQAVSDDTAMFLGYRGPGASYGAGTGVIAMSYGSTGSYKPLTFITSDLERMRIDTSGNVGIGTTAPTARLDVSGTIRAVDFNVATSGAGTEVGYISSSSYGYVAAYDRTAHQYKPLYVDGGSLYLNNASTSNTLINANGGNVGVGTASPLSALHVSGTTALNWASSYGLMTAGMVGVGGSLFVNTPSLNTSNGSGLGVDGSYATQQSLINLKAFGVDSNGGYGSAMAFSVTANQTLIEAMRIISSGNVGVGTVTPTTKLEVNGTISASTVSATYGYFTYISTSNLSGGNSSGDRFTSGSNITGMIANSATSIISISNAGTNTGYFNSNGVLTAPGISATANLTSVTTLYASGNVGIKTSTSTPNETLDVNGGLHIEGPAEFPSAGAGLELGYGSPASTTYIQSYSRSAAAWLPAIIDAAKLTLNVNSGGNVGIGIPSPTAKLEVLGNISASNVYVTATTGTVSATYGYFTNISGSGAGLTNVSASPGGPSGSIQFNLNGSSVSGSTAFEIQNGNVGIGTTAPAVTLQVSGTGINISQTGQTTFETVGGSLLNLALINTTSSTNSGPRIIFHNDTSYADFILLSSGYSNATYGLNDGGNLILANRSGAIKFRTNGYIDAATAMTITSGSNVGIGTATPGTKLDVIGTGLFRPAGASGSTNVFAGAYDFNASTPSYSGAGLMYSGTGVGGNIFSSIPYANLAALGFQNSTNGLIFTNGPTSLILATSSLERMRIDASGNLGISTSSPNAKLDVIGTISASNVYVTATTGTVSATYGYFTYISSTYGLSTAAGDRIVSGTTSMVAQTASNIISITNGGTNTGYFNSNGVLTVPGISITANLTSVTSLYASGNVGIGTAGPEAKLSVVGQISNEVLSLQARSDVTNNGSDIKFYTSNPGFWWEIWNSDAASGSATNDLRFRARNGSGSASEALSIIGLTGNVGIGTTAPASKLSVSGGNISLGLFSTQGASTAKYVGVAGGTDTWTAGSGSTNIGFFTDSDNASGHLEFATHHSGVSSGTRMLIDRDGNVGIGTTSPAANGLTINNATAPTLSFQVNGTRTEYVYDDGTAFYVLPNGGSGSKLVHGDTIWTSSSDRRLKTDITPLSRAYGLSAIAKLEPVTFHWKNPEASRKLQIGLIAQDVQKVIPEVVNRGKPAAATPDGELGIQYPALVVPLIQAVKELKADNDNLRVLVEKQGREFEVYKRAHP
jgi:hypothetical protein